MLVISLILNVKVIEINAIFLNAKTKIIKSSESKLDVTALRMMALKNEAFFSKHYGAKREIDQKS